MRRRPEGVAVLLDECCVLDGSGGVWERSYRALQGADEQSVEDLAGLV
jgi:hypothetical protein